MGELDGLVQMALSQKQLQISQQVQVAVLSKGQEVQKQQAEAVMQLLASSGVVSADKIDVHV